MNAGCWILIMLLPIITACVTGAKINPAAEAAPPVNSFPSLMPLADGRQGFVITEAPQADDALRRDFEQAVVLLNAGEYRPASELLEKVVARAPGVTAPFINLAIAYRHLDLPEQAETQLKAALLLMPGHPAACNEYGLLCRKAGRFAEARQFYEQALARCPDYYPVRKNLAILCDLYLNDTACALENYEIYCAARPEDQQARFWVADLRKRMGE